MCVFCNLEQGHSCLVKAPAVLLFLPMLSAWLLVIQKNSGACVTWISLAWYTMIRPSRMIVERLIRHFRAKEYSDACKHS